MTSYLRPMSQDPVIAEVASGSKRLIVSRLDNGFAAVLIRQERGATTTITLYGTELTALASQILDGLNGRIYAIDDTSSTSGRVHALLDESTELGELSEGQQE